MPGPLDDAMKKLVDASPQDFISWFEPDAQLDGVLPHELKTVHIYADALLKVTLNGELLLLHIEFQSENDARMGERLLEYNTLASREHNYLPVCSCVIYLKSGEVPESPFIRRLPSGEVVVHFHYRSIQLGELHSEELLQTDLVGLLPHLMFTKDGARREVVDKMITGLVSAGKTNSLWIGYALASRVLEADLKWLKRRFAVFSDILKGTPIYQEVLEEGIEKGLEKGREEGRQEAIRQELQRQREVLLDVVLDHFPEIVRLAKKQADSIEDPAILLRLIIKMSTAQTAEEAKQYLLHLGGGEKQS